MECLEAKRNTKKHFTFFLFLFISVKRNKNSLSVLKGKEKKIFEEGYGKGTGYGLYLIRKMCEVYGWAIQETGKPGKGAQFTIIIPKMNESGRTNYKIH